jgi:hypothetical protein
METLAYTCNGGTSVSAKIPHFVAPWSLKSTASARRGSASLGHPRNHRGHDESHIQKMTHEADQSLLHPLEIAPDDEAKDMVATANPMKLVGPGARTRDTLEVRPSATLFDEEQSVEQRGLPAYSNPTQVLLSGTPLKATSSPARDPSREARANAAPPHA